MKMFFPITLIPLFLLAVIFTLKIIEKCKKGSKAIEMLPPGPRKLPIIGNLHHLMSSSVLPHHVLRDLARKHGDLMHLQLGEISTIVLSSPQMAKAMMKTHDLAFANRPELLTGQIILYNCSDIAFSPYGEYWRQMRKICLMELLSTKRVRSLNAIRDDEVSLLISSIRDEARHSKQGTNFTRKVYSYTCSMLQRAALGKVSDQRRDALVKLVTEVLSRMSGFDVSDLFPSWKFIHYLSFMKPKLHDLHHKIDGILNTIIDEHVEKQDRLKTGNDGDQFYHEDLVDVLLRIKESGDLPFPITNTNIKAVVLDMFLGGIESSSSTVEWAMAEMIKNPNVLAKAQGEVRKELIIGKDSLIQESDIQNLSYLKLIIKETLRLHPPAPLLMPRINTTQCEIDGYIIPPNTRAMVNVWAIGRDPKYWENPESFIPERFEKHSIDFGVIHYEFLPFGGGKKMCPGMSFALANIEVLLANLLYHFDWELPNGSSGTSLDMEESYGLTSPRKSDLLLVASMHECLGKL